MLIWFSFSDFKICDLKLGSDGHLKKIKTYNGQQVIAKLKLLLDLTQIISSYNLLGNNKKLNCNINSHNTNKNLVLIYLATKTIESKKFTLLVLHKILVNTSFCKLGELILKYTGEYNTYFA